MLGKLRKVITLLLSHFRNKLFTHLLTHLFTYLLGVEGVEEDSHDVNSKSINVNSKSINVNNESINVNNESINKSTSMSKGGGFVRRGSAQSSLPIKKSQRRVLKRVKELTVQQKK